VDNQVMTNSHKPFVIAQFSDCHLFSDKKSRHLGADVWQNFNRVLTDISQRQVIDCAVFTGDLTQDHTELSYQHFVEAVEQAQLSIPVYFLAGNHDDKSLLAQYLIEPSFKNNTTIDGDFWQIQLLDSKSDTPSGLVTPQSLQIMSTKVDSSKYQLLMMHHHPIDVGYHIDNHGLLEQSAFWRAITVLNKTAINIKGIACGHVHRAMQMSKCNIEVYTCPATSVQFGDTKEDVNSILPSYRLFYLANDGTINTDIITL